MCAKAHKYKRLDVAWAYLLWILITVFQDPKKEATKSSLLPVNLSSRRKVTGEEPQTGTTQSHAYLCCLSRKLVKADLLLNQWLSPICLFFLYQQFIFAWFFVCFSKCFYLFFEYSRQSILISSPPPPTRSSSQILPSCLLTRLHVLSHWKKKKATESN